eukprot:366387-Chlamydomonas_euryale.AAC.5
MSRHFPYSGNNASPQKGTAQHHVRLELEAAMRCLSLVTRLHPISPCIPSAHACHQPMHAISACTPWTQEVYVQGSLACVRSQGGLIPTSIPTSDAQPRLRRAAVQCEDSEQGRGFSPALWSASACLSASHATSASAASRPPAPRRPSNS